MTANLPPNLLKLFSPRPLPEQLRTSDGDRPLHLRTTATQSPLAPFMKYFSAEKPQAATMETPWIRKLRLKAERKQDALESRERQRDEFVKMQTERVAEIAAVNNEQRSGAKTVATQNGGGDDGDVEEGEDVPVVDETNRKLFTADPFRTMFVARLPQDITAAQLHDIFMVFGPCRVHQITKPGSGTQRPYAFVEFDHEASMMDALQAFQQRPLILNGHRVVADVERGRTVSGWLPRRCGGGVGGRQEVERERWQVKRRQQMQQRNKRRRSDDRQGGGDASRRRQ